MKSHPDVISAHPLAETQQVIRVGILMVLDRQRDVMSLRPWTDFPQPSCCRVTHLIPAGLPHRAPISFQDPAHREAQRSRPEGACQRDQRLEGRLRGNAAVQLRMTLMGAGVESPTATLITKRWPSCVTS